MFSNMKNSGVSFFAAFILGAVGAFGQAFLLFHELEHTYPYKVMNYDLYSKIAHVGLFAAPLIALLGGLVSGLRRSWFALIVPVISCPLAFALVFWAVSSVTAGADWNFDNSTPATAALDFYLYAVYLAIAGLVVGAVCALLLNYLLGLKGKKALP